MKSNCFYYGTYTPEGFFSLVQKQEFSAEKNYIIKGLSDCTKQDLFRKIKNELDARGYGYIDFCADERSMGVYSSDAGFRIIDGTYGEKLPDAQVFWLDDVVTNEQRVCILRRKDATLRIQRFLSACRCISKDMIRIEAANMNITKIDRYTTRLWSSTGGELNGSVGTEYKRFVTTFTPEGVELNMEAFDIYCERMVLIYDYAGACARRIVDRLRRYALSAGYDVISCLCPISIESGAEHLIIPELKFGIFTCKYFHRADFKSSKKVCSARFLDSAGEETKNRMDFSLKAYKRLMQEVFSSLKTVKMCDEELSKLSSDISYEDRKREIIEILFSC